MPATVRADDDDDDDGYRNGSGYRHNSGNRPNGNPSRNNITDQPGASYQQSEPAGGESRETIYTPAVKPVMDWLMVALSANATEVEAGRIAQGRAANQDVRQFGQFMVEHHTAALNELVVLAQAYDVEPFLAPVMPLHKRLIENLTQYSGQDFDRFYMRPMVLGRRTDIAHYELGVREQPEDVAAHAAKTLPVIREHLAMAEELAGRVGADLSGT